MISVMTKNCRVFSQPRNIQTYFILILEKTSLDKKNIKKMSFLFYNFAVCTSKTQNDKGKSIFTAIIPALHCYLGYCITFLVILLDSVDKFIQPDEKKQLLIST